MDDIVFRRATAEELPRIVEMEVAVFTGEQGIPADMIRAFAAEDPDCWVAVAGGKICAAVAAWKENGQTHMGRFVVDTALRGHHIGSRLVEHAFRDVFAGGAEILYMETRDVTVKIVSALGGKVTGDSYWFYGDNATPMILRKEDFLEAESRLHPGETL